jgi:hypothetical protein
VAGDETYYENGCEYYSATNRPVWPQRFRELPSIAPTEAEAARQKGPLIDTDYVRMLIDRLDELERQTRPSLGSASEERKDLAAFQALRFACDLVRHVAGWAIDHQMGLAAAGLTFVPLQPSGTKEHPQYLSERSVVDSHVHEKSGGSMSGACDPLAARRSMINFLRANPGAVPGWLQRQTIEAFEALDYGEVQLMVTPVNTGRKRDLTMLRLQLRAVALVAYRRKLGLTKVKALEQVSDALAISRHTLSSWESRLRDEFGRLEVDRTISFAENHASWVAAARKRIRRGEGPEDVESHEALYDDEALMDLAKNFKAAL